MPQLPISKAAELAERELKARGLSESHFIWNIMLNAGGTLYTAIIEPPILADPKRPDGQRLVFVITMDGTVAEWEAWIRRDRVTGGSEKQKSEPGTPSSHALSHSNGFDFGLCVFGNGAAGAVLERRQSVSRVSRRF
jgi:hypothetical protein